MSARFFCIPDVFSKPYFSHPIRRCSRVAEWARFERIPACFRAFISFILSFIYREKKHQNLPARQQKPDKLRICQSLHHRDEAMSFVMDADRGADRDSGRALFLPHRGLISQKSCVMGWTDSHRKKLTRCDVSIWCGRFCHPPSALGEIQDPPDCTGETYICALFPWHSSVVFIGVCVSNCYSLCMPWHFHFSWLDVNSYSLPTTICAKTNSGKICDLLSQNGRKNKQTNRTYLFYLSVISERKPVRSRMLEEVLMEYNLWGVV